MMHVKRGLCCHVGLLMLTNDFSGCTVQQPKESSNEEFQRKMEDLNRLMSESRVIWSRGECSEAERD